MKFADDGPLPEVLTVRQVADAFRVNPKTIYAEIQSGRLPVVRLGRILRVSRRVVASLLQGRAASDGE